LLRHKSLLGQILGGYIYRYTPPPSLRPCFSLFLFYFVYDEHQIIVCCLCVYIVIITPPLIIPEAVSWVDVKALNTTTLEVTWSPSNNTDYYLVTCDLCGMNVSSNETAIVISRLEPGTDYTISVAACASLCSDYVNSTSNTCTSASNCLTLSDSSLVTIVSASVCNSLMS